jgi:hypothetical protein
MFVDVLVYTDCNGFLFVLCAVSLKHADTLRVTTHQVSRQKGLKLNIQFCEIEDAIGGR